MRLNSLQFGKAISAALFVLLLVVAGMKNALAQNLVATLQHGSNISMYYGSNAFVQAHDAAQTGDIITLSSGTFNPTTITKAITLRGAGCCMDTVTGIYPTIFNNSMSADISDEEHFLTVEGICFNSYFYYINLNNPRFIKCNFYNYTCYNESSLMQNAQFVDCFIYNSNVSNNSHNVQFTNSYVYMNPNICTEDRHISCANSIVEFSDNTVQSLLAINSVLFYCYRDGDYHYYPSFINASSSCLFYNCVEIVSNASSSQGLFVNQQNNSNISMVGFASVFETFRRDYSNFSELINERFILKSDFATSFLGNDGTEVGIHGGEAPYNPRPNYMVLKQCNVANQSTIDGKLSVEIQVVSEGE